MNLIQICAVSSIMFFSGCSIIHVERNPEGLKISKYSMGQDLKDVNIHIKRDDAEAYEATVSVGDSNQTFGLSKAAEVGSSLAKKAIIPLPLP